MHLEGVDVSITGNSTNPTRFQHPVAGTYKKECIEEGKKYFSVASGGGTGRTLHPDNMAAGPASYGMTDTMGRMHSDAQFAGSSSVPAPEATEKYFLSCSIHSFLYVPATGCWNLVGFVEFPVIETSTPSKCIIATPSLTSFAP